MESIPITWTLKGLEGRWGGGEGRGGDEAEGEEAVNESFAHFAAIASFLLARPAGL